MRVFKRSRSIRLFEPKARQEGYGLSLFPGQLVLFKSERSSGGFCTWYPLRIRWWPVFRNNSPYEALRSLGVVRRKHYGDNGKEPWVSKRRRRLYQQAVADFRSAVDELNSLPLGPGRYETYQKMREAARRQVKYTRYPRR